MINYDQSPSPKSFSFVFLHAEGPNVETKLMNAYPTSVCSMKVLAVRIDEAQQHAFPYSSGEPRIQNHHWEDHVLRFTTTTKQVVRLSLGFGTWRWGRPWWTKALVGHAQYIHHMLRWHWDPVVFLSHPQILRQRWNPIRFRYLNQLQWRPIRLLTHAFSPAYGIFFSWTDIYGPFCLLRSWIPTSKMALECIWWLETTVPASTQPSSIGPIMDILRNSQNEACSVDDV